MLPYPPSRVDTVLFIIFHIYIRLKATVVLTAKIRSRDIYLSIAPNVNLYLDPNVCMCVCVCVCVCVRVCDRLNSSHSELSLQN